MKNQIEKLRGIPEELKAMSEEDQLMRHRCGDNPNNWDPNIDLRNTARLKGIIDEIGWPSISKVGKESSSFAWLLAQHADQDLEFQKKCLELMKLKPEHEVDKANIAYLEDRIAVNDRKPQIYGTQFFKDSDGQRQPYPIFDKKNIEQRRKDMGLETFEKYQKDVRQKYGRGNSQ